MGSCIGKKTQEGNKVELKQRKVNCEAKMMQYRSLNRELAAARNKELLASCQIIEDLKNQNFLLVGHLKYEIAEKERLYNVRGIIV